MTVSQAPCRLDINADDPAVAVVRFPTTGLIEFAVGSEAGQAGVAALHNDAGIAGQLVFDGPDGIGILANLAQAVICHLRDAHPDHDCHQMLEAMLGIRLPAED